VVFSIYTSEETIGEL